WGPGSVAAGMANPTTTLPVVEAVTVASTVVSKSNVTTDEGVNPLPRALTEDPGGEIPVNRVRVGVVFGLASADTPNSPDDEWSTRPTTETRVMICFLNMGCSSRLAAGSRIATRVTSPLVKQWLETT